jgi:hypothetical protein
MKILILGHGRKYDRNYVRNSPCDIDKWFNMEYVCVDYDPECKPDIVFDLSNIDWTFCSENEYDLIIDTCGLSKLCLRSKYNSFTEQQVKKCLNDNGEFYGYRNTHWKKIDGELQNI